MASGNHKFDFNPFTGNLDKVADISSITVDRLTSTNSTLILSDDATDQTLTGNLGRRKYVDSTSYDFDNDTRIKSGKKLIFDAP